jgi:hypothetical protein
MNQSTDPFELHARRIAADRNFEAAAASYVESYLAWRRSPSGFNRVVSSSARRRIMRSILRLHFGNATENPDDGATFERLLALCNDHAGASGDGCGPRVLRTVISLAQRSGHLTVSQGWYDRRLKILRPTDKWIAEEAERHEAALASLALLAQESPRFTERPRGAALVGGLAVAVGRNNQAVGVALGEPDGSLGGLVAFEGGLSTSLAVADAWIRGRRPPSHKEIGASFRLSASQARKILRLAADRGLVAFDRSGRVGDASALAAACRRLVAHEFALYSHYLTPFETRAEAPLVAAAFVPERPAEHAR